MYLLDRRRRSSGALSLSLSLHPRTWTIDDRRPTTKLTRSLSLSPSSSSSSSMDQDPLTQPLPDDIWIDIFSRLPVKALFQIRCASKSWHALVSHDRHPSLPLPMCGLFNHTNRDKVQFTSLGSRTCIDTSSIDTDLVFMKSAPLPRNFYIHDCCNGFLLLTDSSRIIYICNPATLRWAQISQPKNEFKMLLLTLDRRRSMHYSIVSFPSLGSDEVEVYSSETSEWRKIQGVGRLTSFLHQSHFVFLGGIMYVLRSDIFAVDFEGMVLRRIPRPGPSRNGVLRQYLGHSAGNLHYAVITIDDEMLVWVLEDSRGDEFVLKHRSHVRAIVDKLPGGEAHPTYVGFLGFHSDFDVVFLKLQQYKLFSYHLISSNLEEISSNFEGGEPCFPYTACYSEEMDLLASVYTVT